MSLHETQIPPERGHDEGCDCTLCRMMTQAEAHSLAEEINATPGFEVTHAHWYGFGKPSNQRRAFLLNVQYCSSIPNKVNVTQTFEVVDEAHWHGIREMAIARGPLVAYDAPRPELRPTPEDWEMIHRLNASQDAKRMAILETARHGDDD